MIGGFHLRKDEMKQMRVVVLFSCNLCLQGGVMLTFCLVDLLIVEFIVGLIVELYLS